MDFNTKFSDFLKKKPNITVMGMAWALYWRLYAVIVGFAIIIAFLAEL